MKQITLAILAVAFFLGCGCAEHYSQGERVGLVTKISKKGLLFKSWEASAVIALPGNLNGFAQPEKFDFTVDPSAVAAVQDAAASGKRVKLIYRQWGMAPATIDTRYIVYLIEDVEAKN